MSNKEVQVLYCAPLSRYIQSTCSVCRQAVIFGTANKEDVDSGRYILCCFDCRPSKVKAGESDGSNLPM